MKLNLILINLNMNNQMWLMATIVDSAARWLSRTYVFSSCSIKPLSTNGDSITKHCSTLIKPILCFYPSFHEETSRTTWRSVLKYLWIGQLLICQLLMALENAISSLTPSLTLLIDFSSCLCCNGPFPFLSFHSKLCPLVLVRFYPVLLLFMHLFYLFI